MKRVFLLLGLSLVAGALQADSIPELFQKTKDQVKAGNWNEALVTIEVLDVESARPENAKVQQQLEGPLAFYRGVCDANLDNAAKAQSDFETFLRAQPNASIDDKVYSKKAVTAFAAARKSIASAGPSITRAYDDFRPPANAREAAGPTWGDGPAQWLMTPAEKSAWASAKTDAERTAAYDQFWLVRDTDEDHKFRATYDKRVAFADANLAQDKTTRGSMTDRGMVFILLGPPTYGGRKPIQSGQDKQEQGGMTQGNALTDAANYKRAAAGSTTSAQMATMYDRQNGPTNLAPESNNNYQEVWHYRRELLPKGVSYLQVDAVFVTRKGYGSNVLQRESDILTTLSAAKQKPQ